MPINVDPPAVINGIEESIGFSPPSPRPYGIVLKPSGVSPLSYPMQCGASSFWWKKQTPSYLLYAFIAMAMKPPSRGIMLVKIPCSCLPIAHFVSSCSCITPFQSLICILNQPIPIYDATRRRCRCRKCHISVSTHYSQTDKYTYCFKWCKAGPHCSIRHFVYTHNLKLCSQFNKNRSLPNTSSFMDKLENQEELNHSTLQPPLLCIDVYKICNKVDSSLMVREFVWLNRSISVIES